MSQITRGLPLPAVLETTELSDLVVAVGYSEGELLPPYDSDRHKQQATEILNYLKGKPVVEVPSFFNYKIDLKNPPKRLEVVGAYSDWCVPTTTHDLLDNGHIVHVNENRVLSSSPLPAYWNGRLVLRQVLGGLLDIKCHIFEGDFIFYNDSKKSA